MDIRFKYNNQFITLSILPEDSNDSLQILDESEMDKYGEAKYQIMEGCSYEYKLKSDDSNSALSLHKKRDIVRPSKIDSNRGRITPGNYVGTLTLEVQNESGKIVKELQLEVRSIKTSYREEYQLMLEEITDYCTELLMQAHSPVSQNFIPDYSRSTEILYQKFCFVKSILDSDKFDEAINRIIRTPSTKWKETKEINDIRRLKKVNSSIIKQIVSKRNRVKSTNNIYSKKIETLPQRVRTARKKDIVDTAENQFVKHVLYSFNNFCANIKDKFKNDSKEQKEAEYLENKMDQILNRSFFKEISKLTTVPLNSPVLQKKDGYREILQIWFKFQLASNLTWSGGDEVYSSGKRDVATLYEYWLFFKLLQLLQNIFSLEFDNLSSLIEETKNGLGLKLKAGQHTIISGVYESNIRELRIEFNYNKTFSGNAEYPQSGSWTKSMRPDYTLSIWPKNFSREQAEEQEVIVHIHFDAKYKIKHLKNAVQNSTRKDKKENQGYKRSDLFKMHAYRDAIRRTGGAYILYPGENTKSENHRGFHEIIPGLGAFSLKPSKENSGMDELKNFILRVVEHFLNRTSERENVSFHKYNIYSKKSDTQIEERLPEEHNEERVPPPNEESVLVGYCKNEAHYNWIINKELYNFRTEGARGSLSLGPLETGASYLLLHRENKLVTNEIWEIVSDGLEIYSSAKLKDLNYPSPGHQFYLVCEIAQVNEDFAKDIKWDIRKLSKYKPGRASSIPFAVTLAELMEVKV